MTKNAIQRDCADNKYINFHKIYLNYYKIYKLIINFQYNANIDDSPSKKTGFEYFFHKIKKN